MREGAIVCRSDEECKAAGDLEHCRAKAPDGPTFCFASAAPFDVSDGGTPRDSKVDAASSSRRESAGTGGMPAPDDGGPTAPTTPIGGASGSKGSDPESPYTYIKSDNAQAAAFGSSLVLRNDLLVVGAPLDDSIDKSVRKAGTPARTGEGSEDSGAVYVYRLVDQRWKLEACLKADVAAGAQFGESIAVDEHGERIAVLAGQSNAAPIRAFLYARISDEWSLRWQTMLPVPRRGTYTYHQNIAIHADTLVIAAPWVPEASGSRPGAYVYLLSADSTTATEPSILQIPVLGAALPSTTVAVSDTRIVVALPTEDLGAIDDTGAAYAFARDPNSSRWLSVGTALERPNPDGFANFGRSFVINDKYIVASEPAAQRTIASGEVDESRLDEGFVHVFSAETHQWLFNLRAPGERTLYHCFGMALALDGERLLVGAPHFGSPGEALGLASAQQGCGIGRYKGVGRAYVFDLSHRDPAASAKAFDPPLPDEADEFGSAVGLAGTTIVVASAREDSRATGVGSAELGDNSVDGSGAVFVFKAQ